MEFLPELLHTRQQKRLWEGGGEAKPFDHFLTLERRYLTLGKCDTKQVVPAAQALPRAAGSITTLSGVCLRSCTKRTMPWMHGIPFLIVWGTCMLGAATVT